MTVSVRTKQSVEQQVDALRGRFYGDVEKLAARVREERVIPACKRLNANFTSGIGWGFWFSLNKEGATHKERNITSDLDNKYGLRALFDVLEIEVVPRYELGLFVERVDLS